MLLPGSLATAEELERFRTEAEATARLQHPNIVAVHAVGCLDGRHYYSMDFVDGPSLAQHLGGDPLPERTAARYAVTLARAIHHAHEHGILHRDLKPSNVLLDGRDEPHITDFGLASASAATAADAQARHPARPRTWPPSRPPAESANGAGLRRPRPGRHPLTNCSPDARRSAPRRRSTP
jgi:serine/threonine protein kinase